MYYFRNGIDGVYYECPFFVGIMRNINSCLIICFGFIDMQTVQIMGQEVGLVVSSLLFHSVESVGILLIGIWLSLIK